MSVPLRYLGKFTHNTSKSFIVVRPDPFSTWIQYRYRDGSTWHRLEAGLWYPQVDDGTWIPDVPEYMQVSEGL